MSPTTVLEPAAARAAKAAKRPTPIGPAAAGPQGREAQRRAAAILEVLAGARTPAQAAAALGLSLPHYYQLEGRALRALVAGCAAKPKGRTPSADGALAALRRQHDRLERELARQQALVRLAQRAVGLPAPAAKAAKAPGRRRRPAARAAPVVARLRKEAAAEGPAAEAAAVEGAAR